VTLTVLIFAAHGDLDAAARLAAVVDTLENTSAVTCALSPGGTQLRLGETVTAVGIWSDQARAAGIAAAMHAAISQHPASSVLWRLDDASWPGEHPLAPDLMMIGPSVGGPDAAAVAQAIRLAGRRMSTREIATPAASWSETPAWPAIAIGVLIVGALATAGASAWREAPPARRLTVAPPLTLPQATVPVTAPVPAPVSPAEAGASLDATEIKGRSGEVGPSTAAAINITPPSAASSPPSPGRNLPGQDIQATPERMDPAHNGEGPRAGAADSPAARAEPPPEGALSPKADAPSPEQ
jgi:hypothetical protein